MSEQPTDETMIKNTFQEFPTAARILQDMSNGAEFMSFQLNRKYRVQQTGKDPLTSAKIGTSVEYLINILRIYGHPAIADRLASLHKVIAEEEDCVAISLDSLQNFTRCMITEPMPQNPDIGINPNGLVQATWRAPNQCMLAMNFLVSGDVNFVILFDERDATLPRQKISGILPSHEVIYHIREFADRLTA